MQTFNSLSVRKQWNMVFFIIMYYLTVHLNTIFNASVAPFYFEFS